MNFAQVYNRTDAVRFLRDQFLPEDFAVSQESISPNREFDRITQITKLGESRKLNLSVYEIHHKSEHDPRVTLSRESFRLLSEFAQRRALVFFVSPKSRNYRFSLITIELKEGKKGRTHGEYSNPRRYSFFLGQDAKVATPTKQLVMKHRLRDFNDLHERFSIEVVNKVFYARVAELFNQLAGGQKETIQRQPGSLKLPSQAIDSPKRKEFGVRLIGRLVFCWFLKKKGTTDGPLIPDEVLSLNQARSTEDYYHCLLEPLFFETLNRQLKDRTKAHQSGVWRQIPFLNGGLFAEHPDDFYYAGEFSDPSFFDALVVPDTWLVDLLDVFDTYNFTIDENTPVDVELSVDPEMLGRIFENLLAEINPETGETARKATGSYYTPRPIVEYMVDESLKGYLVTQSGLSPSAIDDLLSYSKDMPALDRRQEQSIIAALEAIRVIDPACGSGAFPMGLLQKMFLILHKLDPDIGGWVSRMLSGVPDLVRHEMEKSLRRESREYLYKLRLIEDTIYGVDIQPIAVEISKLRCFLSLVVDQAVDDTQDNRGIRPLPNLEFKFVCADSLISLPKPADSQKGPVLPGYEEEEDAKSIHKLKDLRDQYFNCYDPKKKRRLEKDFSTTQATMTEFWLKKKTGPRRGLDGREMAAVRETTARMTGALADWKPFVAEKCPWFDAEWMFGIKDGFDIVIANPPYAGFQQMSAELKCLLKPLYVSASGRFDYYMPFIERGMGLLRNEKSVMVYICPTTFLKRDGGAGLRRYIRSKAGLSEIVDFGHQKVFADAMNYTGLFFFGLNQPSQFPVKRMTYENAELTIAEKTEFKERDLSTSGDMWFLPSKVALRIWAELKAGKYLRLGDCAFISEGIVTGMNDAFLLPSAAWSKRAVKTIAVPCHRGSEIHPYFFDVAEELVVYPYDSETEAVIDENRLKKWPELYAHLKTFKSKLQAREYHKSSGKEWYELWNQRKPHLLMTRKLVVSELGDRNSFAISPAGYVYGDTVCGLVPKSANPSFEALMAILNSKLLNYYFRQLSVPKANDFLIYKPLYLAEIPLPRFGSNEDRDLSKLSNRMSTTARMTATSSTDNSSTSVAREIDQIVYRLYDLNRDEIAIVQEETTHVIAS